ncbi:unnamed protein product [[Candida] boidinii]|uniref:Unnamed protein product n=1 Tax=Candida boidinii TaxID=5477 RepID=A0A9W6T4N6_CANBO|nr:hypothetical protein B5S30_g3606 [[Candida] boidinii]OWB81589.1 hypothetical protein B5S33_g208 [[Candida] boidinii]GME75078.1 unnamed protein product [[Candida] boidinii]GMG03436.1 unnamed protein product [[Candida] boidinii]
MKLKSSDSISQDTTLLNTVGYWALSISLYLQIYSSKYHDEFKIKYETDLLPSLSGIDLLYSFHGVLLNFLMVSQLIYGKSLWNFTNQKRDKISLLKLTKLQFLLIFLSVIYKLFKISTSIEQFEFLNFVLFLAYLKIVISTIKYIPQVIHNFKRKSMFGISKLQIFLDLTGCLFASSQLILENPDMSIYELCYYNRSKVGVVLTTIVFDSIYIFQFLIYGSGLKNYDHLPVSEKISYSA